MTFGVDYAAVDGNAPPNFAKAIAAGLGFVFIRGSWAKWEDPQFARDAAAVRKLTLPLGAYVGPDVHVDAPSPADQVAAFHDGAPLTRGADFAPVIDIEFPQGIAGTGMSLAKVVDWIGELHDAVVRCHGVRPIVYSSARVLDGSDTDCLNGAANSILAGCPFWVTDYVLPSRRAPALDVTVTPKLPAAAHGNYWITQTQGDAVGVPGFSSTVDVDRFNFAYSSLLPADGRYPWLAARLPVGASFAGSVASYQAGKRLVADGVIGPRTFAALSWETPHS